MKPELWEEVVRALNERWYVSKGAVIENLESVAEKEFNVKIVPKIKDLRGGVLLYKIENVPESIDDLFVKFEKYLGVKGFLAFFYASFLEGKRADDYLADMLPGEKYLISGDFDLKYLLLPLLTLPGGIKIVFAIELR